MLKKAILSMLLFCPAFAWGQLLSVTATLTDSDSVLWKNGTCQVQVVSPNGAPFFGSTSVPTATQTCTINGSGVLSTSIYNTSTITPVNASYQFVICSATTAPCSSFNTAVVAANMTSTLSALLVAPRFSAYTPFAYGYSDVEVIASAPNGQYYNTTTPAFRQWTGSAWTTIGSGGGGCTTNCTFTGTTTLGTTIMGPAVSILGAGGGTNGTIDFGQNFGAAAFFFYNGGTGSFNQYGMGLESGEVQSFIGDAAHFSWNKGGQLETPGTDELMRLDAATNALTLNGVNVPTIPGTPLASQTVCLLAAGPPPTLGKCTSVVGAGGACTCASF